MDIVVAAASRPPPLPPPPAAGTDESIVSRSFGVDRSFIASNFERRKVLDFKKVHLGT
jgi:hypothetical protein